MKERSEGALWAYAVIVGVWATILAYALFGR
jgi:hypothetical protein